MTVLRTAHTATVDGVRLHWIEARAEAVDDDAPPLVLLHGLNDSHETWNKALPALAAGRRVWIPDLPGHGLSDRPDASYALGWYAHVMAQWLAALDLTNVDLVGHSFGAGVAQVMLLECRQRVRRLVLVSAGGLGREIALPLRLASLPVVIERFGQPFMGLGVHVALHLARDGRTGADIAALRRFNERPGSARAFSRTVRDIIGWSGQRRSFAQRVHEVPDLPPLGVIWGARDAIIPAHHGASLAESVDCVRVTVLPGCGHYLHHQAPVRFANAVRGFLDDDDVLPARVRVPARRARSG